MTIDYEFASPYTDLDLDYPSPHDDDLFAEAFLEYDDEALGELTAEDLDKDVFAAEKRREELLTQQQEELEEEWGAEWDELVESFSSEESSGNLYDAYAGEELESELFGAAEELRREGGAPWAEETLLEPVVMAAEKREDEGEEDDV